MDYEKAYKAVLKTATQWIKDGCTDKERICLESVFPELRESEDERIRKEIIEFIQWSEDRGMTRHDFHQAKRPSEWIAYLEKQKDQKHLSTEETELNSIAFLEQLGYTCVPPGAEQKPADDEAKAIAYREYERGRESGLRDGQKYVLDNAESYGLCKPAEWSEDDEKMLNRIINDYENGDEYWFKAQCSTPFRPKISWLKSLPERFNLQPKQEWSEEDEDKLYQIIETLLADKEIACRDNPQHYDVLCKAYDEQIAWLKSLRPPKDCSSCAKHLEGYISGRSDAENKLLEQFGAIITPEDELHIKSRWKPSKDEERLINTSISFLKDFADKGYENAVECIDWLKSKLNGNTCE